MRSKISFILLFIALIGSAIISQAQNAFLPTVLDSSEHILHLLSNSNLIISVATEITYITGDISTAGSPCSWDMRNVTHDASAETQVSCPFLGTLWEQRVVEKLQGAVKEMSRGLIEFRETYETFAVPGDDLDKYLAETEEVFLEYLNPVNSSEASQVHFHSFWSVAARWIEAAEIISDHVETIHLANGSIDDIRPSLNFIIGNRVSMVRIQHGTLSLVNNNLEIASLLSVRMGKIYRERKIISTVIPLAFTVFALLVFHVLILPVLIRARTMYYCHQLIKLGVPICLTYFSEFRSL
jgi:hypothetical protein